MGISFRTLPNFPLTDFRCDTSSFVCCVLGFFNYPGASYLVDKRHWYFVFTAQRHLIIAMLFGVAVLFHCTLYRSLPLIVCGYCRVNCDCFTDKTVLLGVCFHFRWGISPHAELLRNFVLTNRGWALLPHHAQLSHAVFSMRHLILQMFVCWFFQLPESVLSC